MAEAAGKGRCAVNVRLLSSQPDNPNKLVHTSYQGMGLGDLILLLGAAVYSARKLWAPIQFVTSQHYRKSICDLLVNHPEVEVVCHDGEQSSTHGAMKLYDPAGNSLIQSLEVGPQHWYNQLSIPYKERWDSSPVPDAVAKIEPSDVAPVFVHDDAGRGFKIPVEGYRPPLTDSIIDHVPAIKGAREIHCMDSAFFHLIESMPEVAANLFYYPNLKGHHETNRRHQWHVVA